jgi:ubiquinone biosynthesis protein
MSEEKGVKVTAACRRSPIRRGRIAEQLIEALIAVPLFSREADPVFHGDPHAGNLLYHEPARELVLLDWALAERLDLASRRRLILLVLMTILRDAGGVAEAIEGLGRGSHRLIRKHVIRFFETLPEGYSPGTLDAMRLLDDLALEGIRFPPALFLFRKMLFTLDGVLSDVASTDVRMDQVIAREFLTRWAASFGLFYSPLQMKDLAGVPWTAISNQARRFVKRFSRFGRRSDGLRRAGKAKSGLREKGRRTVLPG